MNWSDIALIVALVALAVNVSSLRSTLRMKRRIMQQQERVEALDNLLTALCTQAIIHQSQPIWRAWGEAGMGSFQVIVKAERKSWDA